MFPNPLQKITGYYSGHLCCPKIVPALGEEEHSVIEIIQECTVQVSILTDWGNCTTLDKGFWWASEGITAHIHKHIGNSFHCITESSTRWYVNWNDGTIDEGCTDHPGPFGPLTHKYTGCGVQKEVWACVFVWYCNSIESTLDQCSHKADCCDMINKCVVMT